MKLEIHIPELAELNTNVRQLIDTLNDLAVVGINAVKREPGREGGSIGPSEEFRAACTATENAAQARRELEAEKPKRTRKTKVEEPAPDPAATEPEPQVEPEPATTVAEPEPEQLVATEPDPQPEPEAPTYVLSDCTDLAEPIQKAQKLDEAKAWLKEHGADRLKDLDPSHYGAFIAFAKGLLG